MDDDKKKTVFSKRVLIIVVVVTAAAIGTLVFWVINNRKLLAQSGVNEMNSNPHSVPTFTHEGAEAICTDNSLANEYSKQSNNPKTLLKSSLEHLMTEEHKNMQTSSYNPVQNTFTNKTEQQNEYSHNQIQSENIEDLNTPVRPAQDLILPLYEVNMLELTESEITKQKDDIISALENGQLELWLSRLEPKKNYGMKSSFELAFMQIYFNYPQYNDALSVYSNSKINFEKSKKYGYKIEEAYEQLIKKEEIWEAKKTVLFKEITVLVHYQHESSEVYKANYNKSLEKLELCIITYYNIKNESKNVLDNAFNKLKNAMLWTGCTYPPFIWAGDHLVQYKVVRDNLIAYNRNEVFKMMSQKVNEAQEVYDNTRSNNFEGISKKIHEYKENKRKGSI